MNRTTTRLRLTLADFWRLNERRIHDIAFGAAMLVALLLIHALLRPAPAPVLAPVVMREAQRPAILVMTATPAPTLPPQPTATPLVVVREVYIEAPTPEPQVIYVQSPPEVVYVEQPAAPTLAPQQLVILDRQQWAQQAAER